MKPTSSILSSLVLILSLTACGGSSSEDSSEQAACVLSPWSTCGVTGNQVRTIVSGKCGSEDPVDPNYTPLVQVCAYYCGTKLIDGYPFTIGYCSEGQPYYCESLNRCYSDATTAVAECEENTILCKELKI
jgi:hypothetical protein